MSASAAEERGRNELHPIFDGELEHAERVDRQIKKRRVRKSQPPVPDILQPEQVRMLVADEVQKETVEAFGPNERDELRVGAHIRVVEVGMEEGEQANGESEIDDENRPTRFGYGECRVLFSTPNPIEANEQEGDGMCAQAESPRGVDGPHLVSERKRHERERRKSPAPP